MPAVVPSLSSDGWVDTPVKMADYLFSHFFLSDFNQTYIYYGHVKSFSSLLMLYGSDAALLAQNLQLTLQEYFQPYFDDVEVTSTDSSTDTESSVLVDVQFSKDGVRYQLGRIITHDGSKVKKIIKVNNEGTQ